MGVSEPTEKLLLLSYSHFLRIAAMNLKDPILQTYVIAASLMCLKMMLQAWMTISRMIKVNGGFLHPEDIKKTPMNPNPSPDQLKPNPMSCVPAVCSATTWKTFRSS